MAVGLLLNTLVLDKVSRSGSVLPGFAWAPILVIHFLPFQGNDGISPLVGICPDAAQQTE